MDDTLQRLLDAELRAEKIAKRAEADLESAIKDAMALAQTNIKQFEAGIPALYSSLAEKAEARADQAMADMKRRHDERHSRLRVLAEQENEVLDAVFAFFIDAASDLAKPGS